MIRWFVQILRDTASALERWLALEPEYATEADLNDLGQALVERINSTDDETKSLRAEVTALRKEIENLSLLAGLRRPMQTVVRSK